MFDELKVVVNPPPEEVENVLLRYPEPLRGCLRGLRALILDVAAKTDDVGPLDETLKWGQPSFLTAKTNSGSTLRIDRFAGSDRSYALYFICTSKLGDAFRMHYPGTFRFDGKRAIVFDVEDAPPETALRHCIALALTYRLWSTSAAT